MYIENSISYGEIASIAIPILGALLTIAIALLKYHRNFENEVLLVTAIIEQLIDKQVNIVITKI
jgi:hypothetical protein